VASTADEAAPADEIRKDPEFAAEAYGDGGVTGLDSSLLVENAVDTAQAA
jgi:hypothetical protein